MKIVSWAAADPSQVWSHEAHDFRPWLADNLR